MNTVEETASKIPCEVEWWDWVLHNNFAALLVDTVIVMNTVAELPGELGKYFRSEKIGRTWFAIEGSIDA